MLNKLLLIGRLTKDPEVRYTNSGTAVCTIRLAASYKYKTSGGEDREEVLYINATLWGKRAENVKERLKKGNLVFVEGRLVTNSWETPQKEKRSTIELNVGFIHYMDREREGTGEEDFNR